VGKTVNIDRKAARTFAMSIYQDISAYIQSHQEEFNLFMEEEENAKNQVTRGRDKVRQKTCRG
jgi:hypothetical protein